MSAAALALVLAVAMIGFAIVLNHCHARLALVELALNEGLPPGHELPSHSPSEVASIEGLLVPGVHVFLSRNCFACQRLVDEFEQSTIVHKTELHMRFVDRPRPVADAAATRIGATLHTHENELATRLHADPLPYTIAVGSLGLAARAVTPTLAQVLVTARDAGLTIDAGEATSAS